MVLNPLAYDLDMADAGSHSQSVSERGAREGGRERHHTTGSARARHDFVAADRAVALAVSLHVAVAAPPDAVASATAWPGKERERDAALEEHRCACASVCVGVPSCRWRP
jgi:hypothetical protein